MPRPVALVLIAASPQGATRVLLFPVPGAFRASIEALLCDAGLDEIEIREDGTMRVADDVSLEVREASVLSWPIAYGVVIRASGVVVSTMLVGDLDEAKTVIENLDDARLTASVVELEAMPLPSPIARHPRWRVAPDPRRAVTEGDLAPSFASAMDARLTELGALIARVDALKAPSGALSSELCPRCEDHPLHLDPSLDAYDRDGRRTCIACARLAALRRAADRGQPDPGLGL